MKPRLSSRDKAALVLAFPAPIAAIVAVILFTIAGRKAVFLEGGGPLGGALWVFVLMIIPGVVMLGLTSLFIAETKRGRITATMIFVTGTLILGLACWAVYEN